MSVYSSYTLEWRKATADSAETPREDLRQLAYDENAEVRRIVAGNPHTPHEAMLKLVEEFPEEFFVALVSACSPTTSANTLTQLAELGDTRILYAVAQHANTPVPVLKQIFAQFSFDALILLRNFKPAIGIALAINPNTPPDLLDQLATSAALSHYCTYPF